MTANELTAAQAKINELETEHAATRQDVQVAIEQARKLNDITRAGNTRLRVLGEAIGQLKAQVAAHVDAENKAKHAAAAEKAKAEAEAKAAAKAQEQSELAKAQAKIAELESALAAKG